MGGQPSDAPALSPPSPLQQGGQSSNAPALSPPSPLPQGSQPIALALSPSSPLPQDGQPSDAPGLLPSSSTLLLCPSDSTLSICHLNSQSAVKTGPGFHQTSKLRPQDLPLPESLLMLLLLLQSHGGGSCYGDRLRCTKLATPTDSRFTRPEDFSLSRDQDSQILRKFKSILNKVTPEKFGSVVNEAQNLDIYSARHYEDIAVLIFEKALSEPKFAAVYAQFYRKLSSTLTAFRRAVL
ncbi:hypothetical protein ACOMHN_051867 [Nucella lapillus]